MFEQILSAVFTKKPGEDKTVGKAVFAITCAFGIGSVVIDAVVKPSFQDGDDSVLQCGDLRIVREGDITVALDTQLTPALIQEGWAREIVSQLQSLRKDSGLEVVDRITVRYQAPAEIAEAIEAQKAYIANEVLALSIDAENGDVQGFTEVKLNDQKALFKITKA